MNSLYRNECIHALYSPGHLHKLWVLVLYIKKGVITPLFGQESTGLRRVKTYHCNMYKISFLVVRKLPWGAKMHTEISLLQNVLLTILSGNDSLTMKPMFWHIFVSLVISYKLFLFGISGVGSGVVKSIFVAVYRHFKKTSKTVKMTSRISMQFACQVGQFLQRRRQYNDPLHHLT